MRALAVYYSAMDEMMFQSLSDFISKSGASIINIYAPSREDLEPVFDYNIRSRIFAEETLRREFPDCLLVSNPSIPAVRIFIEAAKVNNIPVIYVPHLVEASVESDIMLDAVLCWSLDQARNFNNCYITGNPLLDLLKKESTGKKDKHNSRIPNIPRQSFEYFNDLTGIEKIVSIAIDFSNVSTLKDLTNISVAVKNNPRILFFVYDTNESIFTDPTKTLFIDFLREELSNLYNVIFLPHTGTIEEGDFILDSFYYSSIIFSNNLTYCVFGTCLNKNVYLIDFSASRTDTGFNVIKNESEFGNVLLKCEEDLFLTEEERNKILLKYFPGTFDSENCDRIYKVLSAVVEAYKHKEAEYKNILEIFNAKNPELKDPLFFIKQTVLKEL